VSKHTGGSAAPIPACPSNGTTVTYRLNQPKPPIPRTLSDFASDDRGVIAIATALTLTVVILAFGIADRFRTRQETPPGTASPRRRGGPRRRRTRHRQARRPAERRNPHVPRIQDTFLENVLTWTNKQSTRGSGERKQVFVVVSDGISGGRSRGDVWSELMTKPCDPLKERGPLFVFEVNYEELTGDTFFERYIRAFYARITKALKSRASSGSYLSAGTPEEIEN
jgi:hypothetical protein